MKWKKENIKDQFPCQRVETENEGNGDGEGEGKGDDEGNDDGEGEEGDKKETGVEEDKE